MSQDADYTSPHESLRGEAEHFDPLSVESGLEALRASPEFRGSVEPLGDLDANEHIALFYESLDEQFAAVAPFVRQGLERDERVVYVAEEESRDEVLEALRDRGIDVDAARDSGALAFYTLGETYLREGRFDPDTMIEFYREMIEETTSEFSALRIAAHTRWILDDETTIENFMEYESRVNDLFEGEDCIALCQYDREAVPPETLRDVVRTHPHLVYDGTLCHNFYYTPPGEYLEPDEPARDVERMLGTLRERTEAKVELAERQRFLHDQNEITASPDRAFEEKLQALFELGCEQFDLELGAMARVDTEDDWFQVEYISDDHEHFEPGVELPLSETYCTAATEIKAAGSVSTPREEGYDDITVYQEFGIRAYLGTYVEVDGGADRTFFFVTSEPRDEAFSDDELAYLRLMGQWVKYELEHRRREQEQRALYEIAADTELTFDEKLRALFDLGCDRFDLELGGLARIDPDTDIFTVEAVSGNHDHLEPGTQVDLSETYCRVLAEEGKTASIRDPVGDDLDDTLAYEEFGVNTYLGTRIELDSGPDRTFFFVSSEPREKPFSDAERTFHHLMGQWVEHELARKQREDQLATLNTLSRRMMQVETEREVSETVIEAAETALDISVVAIALYDEQSGNLRPAAATDAAERVVEIASVLERGDGVGWTTFVENEPYRTPDPLDGRDASNRPSISELAVLPLGSHGVLVTGSTASDGFSSSTYDVVETVAANTEAALDRAHREQQLHDREETLEGQNEALERLNRVNGLVRGIDRVLVQASTREEVLETVCERLVSEDAYRFAWIGTHDAVADEVTPEARAGTEDGYLDAVTVTVEESDERDDPTGEALRTGETQVRNNLAAGRPFEPWQQAALDRGYQDGLAVPLVYQDTSHGVLTLYADRPNVFDQMEEAVLTELGETIGYALNALKRKRALVSEQSVELELQLRRGDSLLFQFAAEFDCEVAFENLVQQRDGGPRIFFTVRDVPPEEVLAFGSSGAGIEEMTLVSERDGEAFFEVRLRDSTFFSALLDRGAVPQTLTATGEGGYAVIRVPRTSDVRTLLELFEERYEDVELIGRREVDEPIKTRREFEAEFRNRLTERQEEVLKTAYASGFFEWPREMAAQDLAEMLDVSQPTVSRHVRAAERKLFGLVFEGRDD